MSYQFLVSVWPIFLSVWPQYTEIWFVGAIWLSGVMINLIVTLISEFFLTIPSDVTIDPSNLVAHQFFWYRGSLVYPLPQKPTYDQIWESSGSHGRRWRCDDCRWLIAISWTTTNGTFESTFGSIRDHQNDIRRIDGTFESTFGSIMFQWSDLLVQLSSTSKNKLAERRDVTIDPSNLVVYQFFWYRGSLVYP